VKRGRPLKADPEKVREFMRRAKPLKRPEKPLARSELRPGRSKPPRAPAADAEALRAAALAWRGDVWDADGGRCVNCDKAVSRDADSWVWQAHHPLIKQTMKRRGLRDRVHDVAFGVVLCTHCHAEHHGISPVPGDRLPARVWDAVTAVGTWATDVVDRAHPGRASTARPTYEEDQ
jgi:hypothetical protein